MNKDNLRAGSVTTTYSLHEVLENTYNCMESPGASSFFTLSSFFYANYYSEEITPSFFVLVKFNTSYNWYKQDENGGAFLCVCQM